MLESMFDSNDASMYAPSINSESIRKVQETTPINMGTKKDPKLVYIESQCSPFEIIQFKKLLT
jgi:hypothetical protein